jgi:hypothetical protein
MHEKPLQTLFKKLGQELPPLSILYTGNVSAITGFPASCDYFGRLSAAASGGAPESSASRSSRAIE